MAILTGLNTLLATLAFLRSASGYGYPDCVNGPLKNNTVCNRNANPTQRAAALVAAMTIDEKLVNFVEYAYFQLIYDH
jgi:xylan 1,4-beta-xylosidase